MAGQSFAMGEAFGKGFQYGKRKVSSMTNEQFNATSAPELFNETTSDIKAMIPSMSRSFEDFHTLQTDIILKVIDYVAKLPPELAAGAQESLFTPQDNPNAIFKWDEIIKGIQNATKPQQAYADTGPPSSNNNYGTPVTSIDLRAYSDNQLMEALRTAKGNFRTEIRREITRRIPDPTYVDPKHNTVFDTVTGKVQKSIPKKNLPSDPRTIKSKRDKLVTEIAQVAFKMRQLQQQPLPRSSSGKNKQKNTIAGYKRTIQLKQTELTTLLNTYNF